MAVAPMAVAPMVVAPVVAAMVEAPRRPLELVCLLSLPATPGSLRTTKRISSHGLRTMTSTTAKRQNIAQQVSIKNTYKTQTLANIGR